MLLGVVSDTHGDLYRTQDAVRMLEGLEVAQVLHCGDIGTPEIVELFKPWPTHFVFGNCDHDRGVLKEAIEAAGQTCHDRFGSLEFGGLPVAFLHGDDTLLLRNSIASQQWKLICHGHTHVVREEWERDTLILNPGAVHRANPHSIAVVEFPARTVHVLRLDT
jgi:uncharacterized protein